MERREHLLQARVLLGLGREDAAQLTGITGRTIQNWEEGAGGQQAAVVDKLREYIRALQALAIERDIEIGLPADCKQPERLLAPDIFEPKPIRSVA